MRYYYILGLMILSYNIVIVKANPIENVGKTIERATHYYKSGEYVRDVNSILLKSQKDLEHDYVRFSKPAIVLDIDETTLSNWPAMHANGLGYIINGSCDHLPLGPCGEKAWFLKGEAPSFLSTRRLIEQAQAHNVAVFFITGRTEDYRKSTEKNLHKEGIKGWTYLFMRPLGNNKSASVYKTPIRKSIEEKGYTIIINIGDQKSDLKGGYSLHTYLLPNPFYEIP